MAHIKFSQIKYSITCMLTAFVLLAGLGTTAIASGIGYITNFSVKQDRTIAIEMGSHFLYIQVCSENIVKIDFRPNGIYDASTPVIAQHDWKVTEYKLDSNSDYYTISTAAFRLKIKKNPCRIELMDKNGNLLIKEQDVIGVFPGGIKLQHNPTDNLYGIYGYNRDDMQVGLLRQKGGYIQAKPQGGCGAPFVWSTAGYGIIVDTDGGDIYNDGALLSFNNCSKKNMEYYLFTGSPKQILEAAGKISGMPPMLPKWNCGYGQMKWGIDEAEYKSIINGYRSRNIPIDWFMIDFDWMAWGEDHYGEFRWGKKFPSGATGQLKEWSSERGIKLFGITKPRIIAKNADGSFTEQGKYAEEHHFWWPGEKFFPDYVCKLSSKDLNFSIPECRAWWWGHLKTGGYDKGMVAFLNDECDDSNAGGLYSLGNFSNLYMQQSIYDGMRSSNNKRVWSLNRTAYLGSQRYAYGLWSGDNFDSYKDLHSQLGKMLSANNILVDNWGFVVSAFWHDRPPLTPAFYIRSMQVGMFAPVFFVHGMYGQNKQPWVMGTQAEKIAKQVIETRYRWAPYTYSYERQKHERAIGIARPLLMDFPQDDKLKDEYETFLYGDYILVSPVVDSAQTVKEIYFPEGEWIDYTDGKIYTGNRSYKLSINDQTLEDIPMFIRKGAIIPNQDTEDYIGEKKLPYLYVDIFPDTKQTSFDYYDDDGITYDYEKGTFLKQHMAVQDLGDSVTVTVSARSGTYISSTHFYLLKIHYRNSSGVQIENHSLKHFADMNHLINSEKSGWATGSDAYGAVTYVKIKAGENNHINIKIIGKEQHPAAIN